MAKDRDYREVSFREFYDSKRDTEFMANIQGRKEHLLKHIGATDQGPDTYEFLGDRFQAPGAAGAREIVLAFAVWRDRVHDDGGEPTDKFEKPTARGWAD
jgi:hypothetical protein